MKHSRLYSQIKSYVEKGKVDKHFRSGDFDFLKSKSFISKHCEGNPGGYTVYFIRVDEGLYKLKKQ